MSLSQRLPSLQHEYDDFYSGDAAVIQPPELPSDSASPEQVARFKKERAEYDTKIRVARETGNWDEIKIAGSEPTRFVMKPITGTFHRLVFDLSNRPVDPMGSATAMQMTFRAALVRIVDGGLGDRATFKQIRHPDLGMMAEQKIADFLDALEEGIITELAGEVLRRFSLGPKS